MCPVFAFLDFNPVMMLVLGAIAVMLFGERLPEVARSIGKGLMEFKSGIRELQDEFHNAVNSADLGGPAEAEHDILRRAGRSRGSDGAEVRAPSHHLNLSGHCGRLLSSRAASSVG